MYTTYNNMYDRSLKKTPEQLFINSLRKEFELSPAESAGILELMIYRFDTTRSVAVLVQTVMIMDLR